jgi:ubiquinone/menaquinone biosynthesis C-methylase UbiE
MSFYENCILPRLVDVAVGTKDIAVEREKCLAGASGNVLEVGFGTGHNLPFYPRAVKKVVGVDPSGASAKLARKRIANASFPVELLELAGERIAAADASFDSVVSTLSLCTIADPAAALVQMRRVLKPGGRFFFLEHGQSNEREVQRWQDRLNGLQRRLFGGCNINRPIDRLITDAGFEIDKLDRFYGKGPKVFACLYRGTARRPS